MQGTRERPIDTGARTLERGHNNREDRDDIVRVKNTFLNVDSKEQPFAVRKIHSCPSHATVPNIAVLGDVPRSKTVSTYRWSDLQDSEDDYDKRVLRQGDRWNAIPSDVSYPTQYSPPSNIPAPVAAQHSVRTPQWKEAPCRPIADTVRAQASARTTSKVQDGRWSEHVRGPKWKEVHVGAKKHAPARIVYMSEDPWSDVRRVNPDYEKKKKNPSSRQFMFSKDKRDTPKFSCTFYVGIEDEETFTVAKRILGPRGENMKFIADEARGSKIRLRGKGSMKERELSYESSEPLQLNISASYEHAYERAKVLVEKLLIKIYDEYKQMFDVESPKVDLWEYARPAEYY